MIEHRSLSVPEEQGYIAGLDATFKSLKSVEVLRESVTDRVSFTHNVLFDYAVSRLMLDEDSVFSFIREDLSRTIFFRPSLSFFCHTLWLRDRKLFWNIAFKFFEDGSLPERARLIPAVTIYEAAISIDELSLLSNGQTESEIKCTTALLRSIMAFGGIQGNRKQLWITFLLSLRYNLNLSFLNEYLVLLGSASQVAWSENEREIAALASDVLRWMWAMADSLDDGRASQLATVAASRVLPIVLKTYSFDPSRSKEVVLNVLDRLGTKKSSPLEPFWLANEIDSVIDSDPDAAVEVYRRMFEYEETSKEETSLGGSVILSMRSNRKQDYESARYALGVHFQTFLKRAPLHAAVAAVSAVNAEVSRREQGYSSRRNKEEFQFKYFTDSLTYRSDLSEIWDNRVHEVGGLQFLDATLGDIADRFERNADDSGAREMVRAIVTTGQYAVVWKRVIEGAVIRPRAMYQVIQPLLMIPSFIAAPEVTVAVGDYLSAAYKTESVLALEGITIENAILSIPTSTIISRYEKSESIRDRLMMCIPQDRMFTQELRTLSKQVQDARTARENKPYHQIGVTAGSFSDDWIRDERVDTQKPENAAIISTSNLVADFERKHLNSTPNAQACAEIEPHLLHLEQMIDSGTADEKASDHAQGVLPAAAETVLKNGDLSPSDSIVRTCRRIVLRAARNPAPQFNPKYHLPFDMPSWGSSSPRIEAAQGLSHILWNWGEKDSEVTEAIRELSKDHVPAVRFQIAQGLLGFYKHKATTEFWSMVEGMVSDEKTAGVMLGLVQALGAVAGNEPEHVVNVLSKAYESGLPATTRNELTHSIVQIFTGLYVAQGNTNAQRQIQQFELNPLEHDSELTDEVFTASAYLNPQAQGKEVRNRAIEVLERIALCVYREFDRLFKMADGTNEGRAFSAMFAVVDNISLRLKFALEGGPKAGTSPLSLPENLHRRLYFELKPLIRLLTSRKSGNGKHFLAPHTAHNLMEMLNDVLDYDPAALILNASDLCRAAEAFSYQFDSMAITESIKFVERILADHKEVLRDSATANALGDMLDTFVRAGWPEAMQLTYRLDQAVR
jgi:hypothetical protein